MNAFMEDVIFLDAEARLAKRIVALARLFGRQGAQGEITLDLKVSQQEFANLVGVTRESVNKQFREWEKRNVVILDKGCLTLTNPQFFETMAAMSD
jgi:CRP-like cAMP-binding protein